MLFLVGTSIFSGLLRIDTQDDPELSDLLESVIEKTSSWLFSVDKKEISFEGLFLWKLLFL